MSYIEKKFFREGQNETPSQIDLYKNRSSGKLVYRDPNGIEIIVSPQGGLESIINTVNNLEPKYKVYTALLTQSGGDNPAVSYIGTDYGSTLIVGTTYTIASNDTTDFTNVGAPNNDVGTSFVATGEVPNNQNANGNTFVEYNTGAPVVTVLENTIGNIWFGYGDNGIPHIYSDLLFEENKTYLTIGGYSYSIDDVGTFRNSFYYNNADLLRINTQTTNNGYDWDFSNDILKNTPIEIRVYN